LAGLVLGVLGQVALRARLGDGLDHGVALHRLQAVQLFLQFFGAAAGQGNRGHIGILRGEKQTAAPKHISRLLAGGGKSILAQSDLEETRV
jgi:hypothetical protein